MSIQPETITSCLNKIKSSLESEFSSLLLEGEVSNLFMSKTGHWYLTLSDESSSLSAVLFKMDALRNREIKNLKTGDALICQGELSVYPRKGSFQLVVRRLYKRGQGGLKEKFELLKGQLAGEGLFDLARKRKIPAFPGRIALITAQQGAAVRDFVNIYRRRGLWMDLLIFPALVQGVQAPASLMKALQQALTCSVDTVVVTRGGGSMEDLWCFNDEQLIRFLANYPLPLVSAIGHEVDYTLTDYVADLRCETPSAAAEQLTEEQVRVGERFNSLKKSLVSLVKSRISAELRRLELMRPLKVLDRMRETLSSYQKRLHALNWRHQGKGAIGLEQKMLSLEDTFQALDQKVRKRIEKLTHHLDKLNQKLQALSPYKVLGRGYTMVETVEGKLVTSLKAFRALPKKTDLKLHFQEGKGEVQVL